MNKFKKVVIPVLVGIVLTIILEAISILMAAAGHGSYMPAAVFFPGPVLIAFSTKSFTPFVLYLATVQWPVYGLLVGIAKRSPYRSKYIKGLILQHILLLVLCFAFDSDHVLGIDRLIRQFQAMRQEQQGYGIRT